jgi:hypothetical protein
VPAPLVVQNVEVVLSAVGMLVLSAALTCKQHAVLDVDVFESQLDAGLYHLLRALCGL